MDERSRSSSIGRGRTLIELSKLASWASNVSGRESSCIERERERERIVEFLWNDRRSIAKARAARRIDIDYPIPLFASPIHLSRLLCFILRVIRPLIRRLTFPRSLMPSSVNFPSGRYSATHCSTNQCYQERVSQCSRASAASDPTHAR